MGKAKCWEGTVVPGNYDRPLTLHTGNCTDNADSACGQEGRPVKCRGYSLPHRPLHTVYGGAVSSTMSSFQDTLTHHLGRPQASPIGAISRI